jgi:hypothetical protein
MTSAARFFTTSISAAIVKAGRSCNLLDELAVCPYCKGSDVWLGAGCSSTMPQFFYGFCRSCECMGSIGRTPKEAADKWRQGPTEGFRSWFAHLEFETRH